MAVEKIAAIDPDFGMATLDIGGMPTPPFDLYRANDRYVEIVQRHTTAGEDDSKTDWDAVWADYRSYLAGLGFPEVRSVAAIMSVAKAIQKETQKLAGKDLQPAS